MFFRVLTISAFAAATAFAGDLSKTIYGVDSRQDLYQVRDPDVLRVADSTVALFKKENVSVGPKVALLDLEQFGASRSLCRSEPFFEQKLGAFCSGSLIGPDLIMTAGHCIEDEIDCARTNFVFGFAIKKRGVQPTSVASDDVYSCAEIIDREQVGTGADYAIIRLDRAVKGHAPLELAPTDRIAEGTALYVVGHPTGLPLKVASGAKARKSDNPGFFVANLDTYGGNSGSAVFNAKTHLIEGILVRGDDDFVLDEARDCRVSYTTPDGQGRGEDVTRVSVVADLVAALKQKLTVTRTDVQIAVARGAGDITLGLRNDGASASSARTIAVLVIGDKEQSRASVPALAASQAADLKLTFSGLDPAVIQGAGYAARVELRLGARKLRSIDVSIQGLSQDRVELASEPAATLDVARGAGHITVKLRNPAPRRTSEAVTLTVLVDGQVAGTRTLGQLEAGQEELVVVPFAGVDPLRLLTSGALATVRVSFARIVAASADRLLRAENPDAEYLPYAHELAQGRGFVPQTVSIDQRLADLRGAIARLNDLEASKIGASGPNLYATDPASTVLGKAVKLASDETLTADAVAHYAKLADAFWASRTHLRKILFIRTAKRKAYEQLVEKLR